MMSLPRSALQIPSLSRVFSTSSSMMTVLPRFSAGTNAETATPKLTSLLSSEGGRWTLTKDGAALERHFRFKTFTKTWDFMTSVSLQCKIQNHHPEWSNVYNTTFIRWTTHNPAGLSDKDITMAAKCDALAAELGELAPEPEVDVQSCTIRGLADQAAATAGDCCTPSKK
ncbi:pterin 4 alpha carbinolamine dehydratase-domain-containing protein [Mariannaea sp. PMI_226]|nr:pterin 4 alpha carbinolamine dehydratase-domain-containing protein [Mariannaea sp. PMI_226]